MLFGLFKTRTVCPNCQCDDKIKVNNKTNVQICKKCNKRGCVALHCRESNGKEYWVVGVKAMEGYDATVSNQ